nr:putative transcription factor gsfr1 [Quercus suber]
MSCFEWKVWSKSTINTTEHYIGRRRKIRCLYPEDGEKNKCKECRNRNLKCVPQGLYKDRNSTLSHNLNSRLANLETNMDRIMSNGSLRDNDVVSLNASQLKLSVESWNNTGEQHINTSFEPHDENCSNRFPITTRAEREPEKAISGSVAPLMTAFGSAVLSTMARTAGDDQTSPQITSSRNVQPSVRYKRATESLCSIIPSQAELTDIVKHHSAWWPLWRDCVDLRLGNTETQDFQQFASYALADGHPALIATLLVGLAISTNDHQRYLPPVEQWILNDDELASTEHGLRCLMTLGLYHITTLQPRRAWTIYRKANALLQLNGLHLTHSKNEKQGSIFWPLFHADRWVSLLIGLPYTLQDHLCDVRIPSINEMTVDLWMYRQLAVVTGRVIDCLQSVRGPSLSAALAVEEQLDEIVKQLPHGYLDMKEIRSVDVKHAKLIRLYRVLHFYQLRAYVHLPLLLQSSKEERYEFSRKSCIDDNRRVLEAYLEVFDTEPIASMNGGVINFVAFIAAVIILLGMTGYGHQDKGPVSPFPQKDRDWQMIYKVIGAIKASGKGMSAALCGQCHAALETLVHSVQDFRRDVEKTIVLPYFGAITICGRGGNADPRADQSTLDSTVANDLVFDGSTTSNNNSEQSIRYQQDPRRHEDVGLSDISLVYSGPYLSSDTLGAWPTGNVDNMNTLTAAWDGMLNSDDWSWLNADLPPNLIL